MSTIKKTVFKIKNQNGLYEPYHFETSGDLVKLDNGQTLEEKLNEIGQLTDATPDTSGLMSPSDKSKLDQLDVAVIEKMEQDLDDLSQEMNEFKQEPRICYQLEEPMDVPNGTVWIVGE